VAFAMAKAFPKEIAIVWAIHWMPWITAAEDASKTSMKMGSAI